MHSKIYQISEKPIMADDYINALDFVNANWCDYASDMDEDDEKECLDFLPELLKDVCEVNGMEITVKNVEPFIQKWRNGISALAQNDEIRISDYLLGIERLCEHTHVGIWSRFYLEDWSESADDFGEFVQYLHHLGEGAKLYVGGIVDFHF